MLLLVFAVAAAAIFHALGGNHAAFAAAHSHEPASMAQDCGAEPCCPGEAGEPHGADCAMTGSCAFCVPVGPRAILPLPDAAHTDPEQEAAYLDSMLPPHFRPPRLFPSI